MAAAAVDESFASVAKRQDEEDKQLQDGDKLLAALEADLQASEAHLERAEARYTQARKRVAKELGADVHSDAFDPDAEGGSQAVSSTKAAGDEDEKIKEVVAPKGDRSHAGPKNAKVLPEKVLSCQRWLAKRSTDHRAREADRKHRELQRRGDRDRKFESAEVADSGLDATPAAEAPAATAAAPTRDAEKEAAALQQGAKSIAGRLKCLSERPDSSDKRTSLMKVLTAGRPNFYSFNLCDALVDLQQRGELPQALSEELLGVLAAEEGAPGSEGEKITPADWLEHAKKVSHLKRLDDAPFKDVECLYLGSLDGRCLADAEAELEAAEAQLEAAVCLATEAYCGREVLEAEVKAPAQAQVEIDEDRAADLVKAGKKEHKGSKNTSQLSEKVVSCQKWLAARSSEGRARESQKKAKDLLRAGQRDGKRNPDSGYGAA